MVHVQFTYSSPTALSLSPSTSSGRAYYKCLTVTVSYTSAATVDQLLLSSKCISVQILFKNLSTLLAQQNAQSCSVDTFDVVGAVFSPAIQLYTVIVHTLQTRNAVL